MTTPACPSYAGYRFPAEIISHAGWLYFRFPLSLRMVDELLAARGIVVSHETVRQWALKFGQGFANQIRRRLPRTGDKWHLDKVLVRIAGVKHWLWQAVDQAGEVNPSAAQPAHLHLDLHAAALTGLGPRAGEGSCCAAAMKRGHNRDIEVRRCGISTER